jgi:hypothetical protein
MSISIRIFGTDVTERRSPRLYRARATEWTSHIVPAALLRKCGLTELASAVETSASISIERGSVLVRVACDSLETVTEMSRLIVGNERFAELVEDRLLRPSGIDLLGVRFCTADRVFEHSLVQHAHESIVDERFLVARLKNMNAVDTDTGRCLGRNLTAAISRCFDLPTNAFFALYTSPALPFVLELIRSEFRAQTIDFFEKHHPNFTVSRCPLAYSVFASQVTKYARRKNETVPDTVTCVTMPNEAASGMFVVHVQDPLLMRQIAPTVSLYIEHAPADDLPVPDARSYMRLFSATVASPVLVDASGLDLSGRFDKLLAAMLPSVRCVNLARCKGMSSDDLFSILRRDHVSLVDVTACDSMILENCAILNRDIFMRKTVVLPRDGDLFGTLESDCARVRRWWAMMAAFSVSHVLHDADDAEDAAISTQPDEDDD